MYKLEGICNDGYVLVLLVNFVRSIRFIFVKYIFCLVLVISILYY